MNKSSCKDFNLIKVNQFLVQLEQKLKAIFNLSDNLDKSILDEVYKALLHFNVIFFRDQKFEPIFKKAFASKLESQLFIRLLKD